MAQDDVALSTNLQKQLVILKPIYSKYSIQLAPKLSLVAFLEFLKISASKLYNETNNTISNNIYQSHYLFKRVVE